MKKKIIMVLFIAFAAVQLSVPLGMIINKELVLKMGKIYKFKTKPIDPYDAFRGKYVTINLEDNTVIVAANSVLAEKQAAYVLIYTDPDSGGYSFFSKVQSFKPSGGDFVKAEIRNLWNKKYPDSSQYASLDLPFDRYYIDEEKAYKAEDIYRRHSRGTNADAYITVRILNGKAVLEELYVGGKPIMEILTNDPEETNQ